MAIGIASLIGGGALESSDRGPGPLAARQPSLAPTLEDIELICSYEWPCVEAIQVWWCESSGRWKVVSADGSNYGGFQINAVHAYRVAGDLQQLLDARVNTAVAFEIWTERGWDP